MKLPRITFYTLMLLLTVLLFTAALPGYAETNASLTINVVGQGDATANPGPPYSVGQTVSLSATPAAGWVFDSWGMDGDGAWWDSGWDYRLKVSVAAAGTARQNKPAEANVNFTQVLNALGKSGAVDPNSVRVVEVNAGGNVIDANVPLQFDKASDFNANSKAAGTVVWIMKGNTAAGATRHYHIYFDVTSKGIPAPSVTPQVVLTDNVSDEGRSTFRVQTNAGTYFYDKKGAGFTSLNDAQGNDWISWNTAADAAGKFRGIPNLVRPANGGHFHPGSNSATTTLLNEGPLKVTIHSIAGGRTNRWEGIWEIYPSYVKFTVLQAGYDYWFLYEGTPGGKLEPNSDYVVRSDGTQTKASVSWKQSLGAEQWAYIGDPAVNRALFLVQHNSDNAVESYAPSTNNEMAIFGFGRDGALALIKKTDLPNYFTIGLLADPAFNAASQSIKDAYKDLNVTVGASEVRPGALLGNQNPVNFTITGDHTITATFIPVQYTLTINTFGEGTVSKSPNKTTYDHGEVVTLTANPSAGHTFAGWTGDLTGTTNPQTITMLGDRTVNANFAPAYTITTSTDGNGTIELTPDLPGYPAGEPVTVTAVPNPGYEFASWGGDLSGTTNPQSINVNSNFTISATFTAAQYNLSISQVGNGSVAKSPDKPTYSYGEKVTLTATPASGWAFTGWSGDVISPTNPLELTIEGNTALVANFMQEASHTLSVTKVGEGSFTVNPPVGPYPTGTPITITATPAAGWVFTGWTGDQTSSSNPLVFLIGADTAVVANFAQETYELNVTTIGQGNVVKSPNKTTYTPGETVTLTAQPAAGWNFVGWGGSLSGSDNPATVVMNDHKSITATFIRPGQGSLVTDGFNSCTLDTSLWTFIDPRGDSSYKVTGTALEITVPSTEEGHNIWTDGNFSARLMQPAGSGDFQIQARFTSLVSQPFQLQGLLIEEDAANYIRFDSYYARDSMMHIYVQTYNNTIPSKKADIPISATAPVYLRVTRVGDEWTMTYSTDGTTWLEAATFSYGLNVTSAGVFAGNVQPRRNEMAPVHTAVIDYFHNTAAGSPPVDTPLLDLNIVGQGSVAKSPDQQDYSCGERVQLTASPANGATFTGWTGDVESTANPLAVTLSEPTTINAVFSGGSNRFQLYLPLGIND